MRVIFDELVCGELRAASKRAFLDITARLISGGAEGVILGCTEIPVLVLPGEARVPLFDTTALHAQMAVDWALAAK